MAGNTKLIGFTPDGKVQLERWGIKVVVKVSERSLMFMRNACYQQLPSKPQQRKRDDLDDFNVQYDTDVGRIRLDLDVQTAEALAKRLESSQAKFFVFRRAGAKRVGAWIHSLKDAVQAHLDFHNASGEPGIDDGDT